MSCGNQEGKLTSCPKNVIPGHQKNNAFKLYKYCELCKFYQKNSVHNKIQRRKRETVSLTLLKYFHFIIIYK